MSLHPLADALRPDEDVIAQVHSKQEHDVQRHDAGHSHPTHFLSGYSGQDTEHHQQQKHHNLDVAPDRNKRGRHDAELAVLEKLLILDDFGLTGLNARGRSDLLEILDDRVGTGSTIMLGQIPVKDWHAFINDPALADAILDRLIHSSHKLELKGDSMRKRRSASAK